MGLGEPQTQVSRTLPCPPLQPGKRTDRSWESEMRSGQTATWNPGRKGCRHESGGTREIKQRPNALSLVTGRGQDHGKATGDSPRFCPDQELDGLFHKELEKGQRWWLPRVQGCVYGGPATHLQLTSKSQAFPRGAAYSISPQATAPQNCAMSS